MLPHETQRTADRAAAVGWSVHVEIQLEDHPPDDVVRAAAAALVTELRPWSAAAFGGRGTVTLLADQPEVGPAGADQAGQARVLDLALGVVSRYARVRRIRPVRDEAPG